MNIIWISGKCGCGKTELANSIIRNFERENKKTCKLDCQDFVDVLVRNLRNKVPLDNMVRYFQEYDLVVLDDVDLNLSGKRVTQKEIKWIIQEIIKNSKTKIILITQKGARRLGRLKFNSDECFYLHLKPPTGDFKRKLVKNWLNNNQNFSKEKCEEIINSTNNLFELKGLCERIKFSKRLSHAS